MNAIVGVFENRLGRTLCRGSSAGRAALARFSCRFRGATAIEIPAHQHDTESFSSALDAFIQGPSGTGYGDLGLYTQVYPSARGSGIPGTVEVRFVETEVLPLSVIPPTLV